MCVSPGILPNGQLIGCRKCWQCKERRIDDWVGRCIAESKTAKACHFVTLTYGEATEDGKDEGTRVGAKDHERTAVLTYSDVQKFMKKVRFDGFKVKYFAVGEYGSLKGRAHWHLLMFWQERVPSLPLMRRIHSKWWADEDGKPLGFVRWEKLTNKSVRYAMKYLTKDMEETARQGYFCHVEKTAPRKRVFRASR